MKQVSELTESEARELLRQYQEWAKICSEFYIFIHAIKSIANLEPLTPKVEVLNE